MQNYFNPFNSSTTITWQSPAGGRQTLKIFNIMGNEVATLVDEYKQAGVYEMEFDANKLTSAVYFYQLITRNFMETKKFILINNAYKMPLITKLVITKLLYEVIRHLIIVI